MTDLEKTINTWNRERYGWAARPQHKGGKFAEEAHELLDALRDYSKEPNAHTRSALAEEIGDIGILLICMAGAMGLSLERLIRRKHESNLARIAGNGKPLKD